jgi:putative transcriptional regulator
MVTYHPDSRFLTDFASGALPMSEAMCVAAHLHYCGKCRARVQQLTDVGSHIFAGIDPEAVESAGKAADFDDLMQRLESEGGVEAEPVARSEEPARPVVDNLRLGTAALPSVLRKLASNGLSQLNWVQLGKSLRIAPVDIGDGARRETAIYDIKAGGRMPEHRHRGEEITVLLKGSFSDMEGKYSEGDFVVRNAGECHQPTATEDTDCICLVSLERPVRAKSFWYRLLEPLVQYRLSRTVN